MERNEILDRWWQALYNCTERPNGLGNREQSYPTVVQRCLNQHACSDIKTKQPTMHVQHPRDYVNPNREALTEHVDSGSR